MHLTVNLSFTDDELRGFALPTGPASSPLPLNPISNEEEVTCAQRLFHGRLLCAVPHLDPFPVLSPLPAHLVRVFARSCAPRPLRAP